MPSDAATHGHHDSVVYGVVEFSSGVPLRVTVAFPSPAVADHWARQQRGTDAYRVTPLDFVATRPPAAHRAAS